MPRHPKPLSLRELVARLKKLGVEQFATKHRGKGSEIILVRTKTPNSKQGPQYPIKNHGPGTQISLGTLVACLRALEIDSNTFWDF